ncbi:hypothetical protein ACG2LH_16635 [Zhouia sp. PK063]|uniref:hypothetical protein n=1 Tax=Zhouia sp. PK063 TaxID=3373602 RepID=UPI0037BC9F02
MSKIIIVVMLLISTCLFGQDKVDNSIMYDKTNIYYDAVYRFLFPVKEKKEQIIIENNSITDYLPKQVGNISLEIINTSDKLFLKRLRKEKKIRIRRVIPIKVTPSGQFKISIIYFDVIYKKKSEIEFVNMGGLDILYEYDSDNKVFVFQEIE